MPTAPPQSAAPSIPAKSSRFAHAWRALHHRNFRLFFVGQGISLMGTWMTRLALAWLTYRLTGSALLLGIVGFSGQIGTALLAPFAGVWVDRLNRQHLLLATQILSGAQSLTLAALTLTGRITIHEILVLAAFQGLVDAFDMPARQTFMTEMVGRSREDLGNAIALNSSLVNAARLIGPAIAGFLIARVGEGYCFLVDGLSYLAVIASLLLMHLSANAQGRRNREPVLTQLRQGWTYVSTFHPVRTILLLFAVTSLVGLPFTTVLPIYAAKILHGGAHTLGLLTAASGSGALAAALFLATRRSVLGLARNLLFASVLFGAAVVGFSFARSLPVAMLTLALAGFGMMQGMASSNTVIQTVVPEERRGRVMGFYTLAFAGMMPFGSLFIGALAQRIGAPHTVLLAGILVLLGAAWYATALPRLNHEIAPIFTQLGLHPTK